MYCAKSLSTHGIAVTTRERTSCGGVLGQYASRCGCRCFLIVAQPEVEHISKTGVIKQTAKVILPRGVNVHKTGKR